MDPMSFLLKVAPPCQDSIFQKFTGELRDEYFLWMFTVAILLKKTWFSASDVKKNQQKLTNIAQ